MATNNKNTDWRANVKAMMTDPNFAARVTTAVDNTRKLNINLMKKSAEDYPALSLDKPTSKPLDLSRVEQMQTEQAARATMPDDDSGVADLAVKAYADARKQIGDEVSKQMADDKSMAFVHPMAAGILRSAESMKAGDVQKTFDRMLENNAVRQAIETKANKELTAALGENPALTEEQQKDIYNKSVQRQIDAISNKVNQYLLDVNAPKSEGEYVLKSAVGNSLIGKSMLQAARNISGLESAEYDYAQQALADYDANKASWYAKGGAAIGGLLLDAPMMQGIGSASSAVLGRGTSMALGKAASNTLWGKMLIGQATAAGTLGGYNFTSTLASQMMGGHFDAGELFGSTLHGVGLGAATGGMTPLLRGATAGMGAVGKTATMGGGILGEAAAFSAPEWVETFNENPYDFKSYAEALGTNVMVIAGLKASNLPKTVQEYKEWWNQGKTSNFTDADYKALSDYALAKGYANDGAFTYQDGVYQRSMADRATGGRNILTLTKLEGGKERNLAMEMYQDPNVPLSMKTKIAAKMGLPAPNPVLPNAVEARDNVVNTYYEYREQMSDGTYVTRRILVDSKEMPSKRKARVAASEFGRTKARQNSIIQSEAEANTDATNAIVMARLTEQAWRSGTNVSDEVARMYDIAQRAQRGEASAEDIAYYQSVMEGTTEVTDRIKADIKAKTGVDIDEVLKQEGTFNTAQDKALTMYTEALASLKDNSKPTTERGTTASQASIADYIELKGMGIEQTRQLLNDPAAKVAAEKEIRNKYALWLKYFDGQMSEEQLASRLGYNLDSTKGLMEFVNEEAFFRDKAANRIAYNAANAAKRLLEQGSGGVRFTEDGKVKLQGVPYAISVDESIVDRYRAAQQGSGENYQRIANDALKDIIKQSEQPIEEMLQQMAADEQAISNEPQTEQEAVTQQMVDNRLAEIDTDLQGIEADGIQRVNINDKPAMIVKGRIAYISNGEIDRANSSTEVAYIPLDENGRPIKNEQGKPVVEVGVKPSNVRISEVEPWRTVEDYKRAEEQRIRDNNRITDEAMVQVDEQTEVENQVPTEPKTADDLLAMCDGDKALALDVATDELAKAMQAKGKGATPAETIEINKRIRMYQQMVDRLSATEQPDAATLPEAEQTATKAEPQVTDDMEFIYQGLDESHEGMEPMQMADGRYKWVGLQRGELTATMGERDVELLDGLAKKLGVAIIPIDVADSAVNGYYRDGNIYVNTNRGAEWTMRWVAGHEMLHDVAKKSPEAYDAYKQAVLDMWGSDYIDNQVKQIIDDYAASGKTIDREQALTELVNDFGGELFNSRDGLNILDNILKDESRKGNTGFVNTIKQWWERLKEFFGGTPYYNEAQKMLEQAYKDAMQNVDYKAREEQLSKDMDDAFFGEPDVVKPRDAETELNETKDYTPTKMPSGTAIEGKPSGDFSVKSIMRGVGIDAQTDGDNVWFEKDGRTFSKAAPMSVEESKSGILKDMVDQCKELGLMDDAKAEDVYKMYTDIVNKIIEKADGSFADLNNQYLWLGETVYRVVHSNSDKQYKRSLDVTLVCKKNEAVIRGISELQRRQGFGVTPSQIMQLYYSTLDKGYQVPCPVCYVFSRYIQNGQYVSNLIYGHHKFDKDKYFKSPAKMSAKMKAEAEQYWFDKYKEAVAWEEANEKLINDAKSVLSWATKEMDMLMYDAAKGRLDKAKRKEYKERASKLDAWYRAALDLVAQSDMSGYIKSVIASPITKDKKVVGMEMREDAGQKMTQEVEETILDYRKVALAKTKYPHISRYIASKGSAAGKGFNFESDNPMGDILQQLSTDSENYFQKAMDAASEKERNKLIKSAKSRTMASAKYAAQQSLRGGVRQWSWSDNIEALAPDVALNAMQVGMLGGAMQTYSKQLEGIEMMAAMNAYVNGSLMGKGMGYQKVSAGYNEAPKWQDPNTGDWYTLHFDDIVGVQPYSRNGKLGLFDLNDMYDRAGNILVGMNDIHIRTAMADPRIFFIIPWHASGMSDHILKQMNSMLKLDMAGFKASDYTKHQEEKMYENKVKKQKDENGVEIEVEEIDEIPDGTTQLWQTHDYSEKFVNRDGTQPKIELAEGQLSADQLHYRELRDAIFMHSNAESAGDTDKAFWAEHQDWLAEIKNDIFLNQVLESVTNGPGRFGAAMTKDDCGFIYPYEYWDKTSTFDNADINGQRYVEYCRRLGVKPKFSGVDSGAASNYGNFIDDAGYWKLLIDRRMYDREGKYQELTPVDPSGFKADFVDQDKTAARFPVTIVADKEATSDIVDDVQYNELKAYKKKKLKVDYKILPETAVKNAAEALMQYNLSKQLVSMTKTGKIKVVNQKELYELELGRLANEEALADIENDNFLADEGAEMSIVRDRNKIEELEGEELVPMLRTFQILDGALYSPMATIQRGKKVHSVVEGDWWKADENPDLAKVKVKGKKDEFYDKDDDRISKKDDKWVITIDGEDKPLATNGNSLSYYFNLKKGEKGDVVTDDLDVSYNPYIHSSKSALNDQFKGAYLRPNLALVEVLVPKSELDGTNRYKADYAKDGIGEVDWNSGTVIKQAVAAGHPGRKVALSRYAKIGRVFTNAEWADRIDEELAPYKDKITLPFISFPPEVLRGLANKGYKIEPPTSKKAQPYYEAWLKGEEPTDSNGGGEYSIKSDKQKQLDIINRTNPAPDDYHTWVRTIDDIKTLQEAVDEVRAEDPEYNLSSYPDVTDDMINKALQSGKVTVYSSYPIKEGVFVSPSKMQAKDYAGGGKVYSKQVSISDVAWINTDEGMFAPTEYSVRGKRADESVLDYAKRVSEETDKKNLLNGGSYFSGGGLLEEGLKGIVNPIIAVEFNQKVAGVYRNNFGEHIVTADVRNVDPASLVKNIDGPVAYFHASPVCKNFSKAKQSAEELPLDKATAQSTAEFISKVRPKIVTIENVKGYRDSESMKIILDELKKQGYNYDVDVYNAADYGAYTSRERLIVRAVRDWSLPAKPMVMLADDRPSGWLEAVADIIDTLPEKKGGVAKWMDERLMAMGIDYRNIDKPLYVFGSGYSKDRIGYAFADELVPTLRTKGGDVIVMPDGRVLKATPRVLARISGMSDEYEMPKTDDLAHTIVGNGIPVQLTKAVMGSLIENVKSDLDSGATEYSIIGKRGASNLDKRDESGIRADNLATAEDMEKAGKDAKTIRMATGWERGADGKWRYEIADAKLLPWEVWSKKRAPKLKDIVENADELFAAYPELKDVKVKKGRKGVSGGSFGNNIITLNSGIMEFLEKYGTADDVLSGNKEINNTLIHEIQHYIQDAEGFAQGGDKSTILDRKLQEEVSSLIDEINDDVDIYNSLSSSDPIKQMLRYAIEDKRAELARLKRGSQLGYDGYHRLAGEVEARNAGKRLGMTEEERKNSLLADTEDVGRDEQIVYGNTDDEYSIKIRGKEYRNDGYTQREDGTNVSVRALDAEENGTYPKGIFAKVYGVSRKDFDTLADLGVIENTEWHHTGTNFNKTDYFSWADSDEAKDGDVDYSDLSNLDAQSMGARYKANKKEISSLINKYNESEWGALPKMKRNIPTLEAFTERYVTNTTGLTSSDQWLTSAERKQKAENHNEVSASATMRDSYERYLTHKYIDELYYETAEKHKNDWIEAHSEEIQNEYNSLKKEVDEYNLAVKPIAEVYSNHAKGKYLMQALELLGYSPEDAAEIIARRHKSDNWDSYTRKAEMARDAVNKEYDEKIKTAQKNLDKWLSKAVKDGKAEFIERVATKPEYFITTKEEMNGRYGWFEATSRYNLPTYYSGYKFESKRMFDSYKRRTGQITDIRREASSKAVDAYNTELDKRYAVEFSIKGGNTPKKQTDEVARLKQKIEQLSQEKDAIAEDGAKVKDIASEMTNFIKQNISTEVQSDMTRNQFKGILNQLENAVTKKDLEKPMQMVEHIGTNVTRRSLTRQMRNFLKSEFKSMTPQGAVKAKTVDGATSRVLELAKTMYATMNKLPLGGEVAALQKQMRDLKADATEWATDQSADTKNLLADVLKTTERPAATRYSELTELRNKMAADGSASGEMLGYIDHMLDIMGDIDYFRGEQQKAKEASALNSKEDLEALKSELLDKSDKGILSEEDKAVLDNMPLYEMMVNLRQQQLDIDGGGAASIDAQIRNKQNAIKAYRAKMNELPKTNTTGRERYKKLIEQVEGEIDDLFASRIVDQKAVNNGMRELIDDLVTLKEQGHSRLVEWSKGKQERSNGIRKLANDSFSSTARGYWDEVNKKGHRLRDINNFLNNAKLTVISPALSFEYMLGTLDKKYYTNDSPIYNRFIKSQDGLLKANDNFFEGLEAYNKEVNAAANRLIGRGAITNMAEWFKKGDRFATEKIPFAFEVDQMFSDGTVRKVTKGITATMTRGQAAKIYAWSRMADGMAKLKAHGVADETIAAVKDFIGEGYMRFVDWVEDDFFPRLRREKYNPKYKEIYGISMAENEHYFPFAIYKKDVRTNTDLEQIGDDKLGGGLVGNLIERKRNNARLDFTRKSPDIFDMITRYGETMEEWAAYAQVREDLKAMVNDKQFKVKCDMFGTDYYKHFLEAARVASRTSDDKALAGKWNTSMSKLQKVLASGAISMRVSTALKQLLSAPAFAVYSLDPKFLHQLEKTVVPIDVESAIKGLWKIGSGDLAEAKKLLLNENWVGHYNWCVNNLPSFRERVSLGGAGNPILEEKGFFKLCDAVQSLGMIPNRLVDAFTCSTGAKAVYEYNFNKYKKMYGEKAAHNMAVTEAEIAFNSSQQSSNPVFLSPMQVSKQFLLRGLMNFKNSPIGYLRAGLKANTDIVRAIKSIYNPTFKVDGQEMRFNSNGKNAASMLMTAAARSAMYNFFLNFIWNLGTVGIAGLSYTAMRNLSGEGSEDGNLLYTDEEWKKAEGDNLASTLFLCATQGLPYISGPFATAEQGTEFAPLMLFNTLNEMGTDIYQNGLVSPVTAQWITNLALKNGTGIDPQVCAQVYEGLQGILADRPVTEEDIMNLLASPRSAISGMTKQKVGEFDRMRDYVDARIKSNREIGIDERMDFGKALAGKRELRKSNLDYYIDEYLEANIPGYREISGRKSKETKQEEQANKKLYEQSMSLVEKIVGNSKGEADEQKASKIDSKDEDIKYMVRRLRDAVAAIHKLYAAGDFSTAEDIAEEMQRRIERGYDPNGKTLDERLKNVDIWEPVGEVKQDSPDGYYTNFDRAIGGEFKKTYVGKMSGEGN